MMHLIFDDKIYDTKVTALIPEDTVSETKKYSGGKNITESLMIALKDYIGRQKIKDH
ncbi:MAG: hypothetical protein WDN75_14925 [Bacteroidota bacterium]